MTRLKFWLCYLIGLGGGEGICAKDLQEAPVSLAETGTHLNEFTWHTQTSSTWCLLLQSTSKRVWEGGFHRVGRMASPTLPVWPKGRALSCIHQPHSFWLKRQFRDFPGDTGSIPDPGRSHMPWSLQATTMDPMCKY